MSAGVLLGNDTDHGEETDGETPAEASRVEESSDSPPGGAGAGGRFRQSVKKVWRKILGNKPPGERGEWPVVRGKRVVDENGGRKWSPRHLMNALFLSVCFFNSTGCVTHEEFRDFAMMSFYTF